MSLGLALLVEVGLLVVLTAVRPAEVLGLPAAVTVAIAGTVAVVLGPLDGVLVALVGATAFGLGVGWGPGELASLGWWPAIALAAGMFARRVEIERDAIRRVVAAQELERQKVALELHEEVAQTLSAALLAMPPSQGHDTDAVDARRLIRQTIQRLRRLAFELRPKVLDELGLEAAINTLAESFTKRTGIPVGIDDTPPAGRIAGEIELALYRTIQQGLADAADCGAHNVRITLQHQRRTRSAIVKAQFDLPLATPDHTSAAMAALHARIGLLYGRITITSPQPGVTTLRADIPA